VRVQGLTTLGFYRDDAWAALSSKVGIGTAWHMWVTAPGFFFLERSFIDLHAQSTWWAQLPALAAGIAAIPAIYFLARFFGFSRVVGLVLAYAVTVSPVCVVYSTRVKEYSTVFLLSAALLWAAEAARRQADRRRLAVLSVLSVLAFVVSASVGPVIAGVWIASGIRVLRNPGRRKDVAVGAVITAALCGVVAALFYRDVSPALTRFWDGSYITLGSGFFTTARASLSSLYANLLHFTGVAPAGEFVLLVVVLAVSIAGATRNAAMLGPACAVLVAVGLSIGRKAPLGTGRTDEYLYPVLLLLLASGAVRLWAAARRSLHPAHLKVVASVVAVASLALAGALLVDGIATATPYPGVNVQALATALRHDARPSDHIVVGELTRYSWAYYEDHPLRLRFGPDWATYFTVASTNPKIFIAPSEFYEGDDHPARWAAAFDDEHRLWFVLTPPLSLNPSYGALLRDGWRPVRTLHAAGCAAILLER
jgi:Dolichyl-phosphate-mannose-protein mannosyltransferase